MVFSSSRVVVVVGWGLDLMTSEVFSNLNDSVILWSLSRVCGPRRAVWKHQPRTRLLPGLKYGVTPASLGTRNTHSGLSGFAVRVTYLFPAQNLLPGFQWAFSRHKEFAKGKAYYGLVIFHIHSLLVRWSTRHHNAHNNATAFPKSTAFGTILQL